MVLSDISISTLYLLTSTIHYPFTCMRTLPQPAIGAKNRPDRAVWARCRNDPIGPDAHQSTDTGRTAQQQGRPTKLSRGFFSGSGRLCWFVLESHSPAGIRTKDATSTEPERLGFLSFFVLDRIMQVARQRVELFWSRCTGNDAAGFVTLSWCEHVSKNFLPCTCETQLL